MLLQLPKQRRWDRRRAWTAVDVSSPRSWAVAPDQRLPWAAIIVAGRSTWGSAMLFCCKLLLLIFCVDGGLSCGQLWLRAVHVCETGGVECPAECGLWVVFSAIVAIVARNESTMYTTYNYHHEEARTLLVLIARKQGAARQQWLSLKFSVILLSFTRICQCF